MGIIHAGVPWRSQPPAELTRVNTQHWLANDLLFVHSGVTGFVGHEPKPPSGVVVPRGGPTVGVAPSQLAGARVVTPNNAGYELYTIPPQSNYGITLATWVAAATSSADHGLVGIGSSTAALNSSFIRLSSSEELEAGSVSSGGTSFIAEALGYVANTWQHGVGVFVSGTNRTAYRDGGNANNDTFSSGSGIDCDTVSVAARYRGGAAANICNTTIRGIALSMVIRRALSADEVLRLYQEQREDPWGVFAEQPIWVPVSAGATTHPVSGALASAAAAIAGSAAHLTLHATSGALQADPAAIAGTATHLTLHTTDGALASDAATIAGEAEHTEPGGATHTTTGALTAAAAAVAGSATHLTLHTTTGALSAQAATVAGSAAHLTLHTTTGALQADAATMAGTAVHSGAGAVVPSKQGAGRPSRTRRARVVEIDGEDFIVNSAEEAEALLENAREQAKQLAATAVKRAAAAERRPVRKVIADARRLLETPEIKAPEDLQPLAEQARADIEAIYQSALASVEIAALLARRQREEEDDEDVLMLIA